MQVIRARRSSTPVTTHLAILGALAIGALCLGAGLAIAYVALTTPLVADLSILGQGRLGRPLGGTLVWALAFLVPGTLVVFGIAQLWLATERWLALRDARPRPVAALASTLSDEYSVIQNLRLPDRRLLPEVVVGPHGILLVEELPPVKATRRHGPYWEVRLRTGRWVPIENPVERAARDAERLRSWLGSAEESFAPRTYVAVIADGHQIERDGVVGVLDRQQLPGYLASMPPARQMTPDRRQRLIELLRERI
jgi:hypothetical protein